MKKIALIITLAVLSAGMGAMFFAKHVAAQSPDIRDIKPLMVLAVDSSGSMERTMDCVCSTPDCDECLPTCGATSERNRWATVVESLNGSIPTYSCTHETRNTAAYVGRFDYTYYIPHVAFDTTGQLSDGLLDSYIDRIRFGLMTFDGIGTLSTSEPLVETATFTGAAFLAQSRAEPGMYSYGEPKEFYLPGCPTTYTIDVGAQSASSPSGGLVSVGAYNTDQAVINAQIQTALQSVRPFGATPIAGMLDDVRYYFDNNDDVIPSDGSTGDPYYSCRPRYVLLLTDGYPNLDMREAPYSCEQTGSTCPYERPEEIASDLCQYDPASGQCSGAIDGLFVVGFALDDNAAIARLNDIAALGGTTEAFLANDRATLLASLSAVFDRAATGTTSRTIPTVANATSSGGFPGQYQFTTGFQVGDTSSAPWSGVLERTRYECNSSLEPVQQPLSDASGDRFQVVLNQRTAPRKLYTIIPSDTADLDGYLIGDTFGGSAPTVSSGDVRNPGASAGSGNASCSVGPLGSVDHTTIAAPDQDGLSLAEFNIANSSITPAIVGAATNAERDAVINWIHGEAGTARESKRLGDIYNSSPVVVGPPQYDLPDESFNLFRQTDAVKYRPKVVYVGTNDGILHAFAAERTEISAGPHSGTTLESGEELWGFIPPVLLPKLKSATASHQWMLDGTAIVKDVFGARTPGAAASASIYRTVLLVGLRGGGGAYFALDVTDPLDPKFLWQFAAPGFEATYALPGLAQYLIGEDTSLEERGLAILPGGKATDITGTGGTCGAPADTTGCTPTGKGAAPTSDGATSSRTKFKCWGVEGRHLYFVDVGSGTLLRHFDDRVFNSPLTGGISFFTGEVGTLASRAFITDADGVIWRADMSSSNIANWSVSPFHDIFWDAGAREGQNAYYPPVISTDKTGKVVVIQATGNVDNLDDNSYHRVVSLTENLTYNDSGVVTDVAAKINWEIRLEQSEQATGPLELFSGKVYFGSFKSASDPSNLCNFGISRLWGVSYLDNVSGTLDPVPGIESVAGSGVFDATYIGPYTNQIVTGVSIVQRPTCYAGREEVDPYTGRRYVVEQTSGGSFSLVGQVSGTQPSTTGPAVSTITRALPMPDRYTHIQAWAGEVEY